MLEIAVVIKCDHLPLRRLHFFALCIPHCRKLFSSISARRSKPHTYHVYEDELNLTFLFVHMPDLVSLLRISRFLGCKWKWVEIFIRNFRLVVDLVYNRKRCVDNSKNSDCFYVVKHSVQIWT